MKPTDRLSVRESTTIDSGNYFLPNGITIEANDIAIDGNGAHLVGLNRKGVGIQLEGCRNVTLRNFRISEFYHGIICKDCSGILIENCEINSTAEVAANTIFLDIWLPSDRAYGGAILLTGCVDCEIRDNNFQHQQSGILTYHCRNLKVINNLVNYNSGYGIHLYNTCDSLFERNSADYCSRFEPRDGGLAFGHMGADATGFLIVHSSCRNIFRRNWARMGGDGFFLAGLSPDGDKVGCNDNLFEENDASLSPNIAFEATFSSGNKFLNNYADRCNYGFWLGFSWDNVIAGNRMIMNRQAGIGVENGHGMVVESNILQSNGHGILLWTHYVEQFATQFADHLTSYDWIITKNTFTKNGRGIRIAADQDHGIRKLPEERCGRESTRPRDHKIVENDIQDNRIGIELISADNTIVEGNILNCNVEANFREDDCNETVRRNNLGSGGGYL